MGALIIGDVEVEELGPKFVNWRMNGWDATQEICVFSPTPCITPYGQPPANGGSSKRYALRPALRKYGYPRTSGWKPPPPAEVAKYIRKFVIHHDGLTSGEMCWNVLQNERGLSCHFILDNDGTIYQTIDLAYMAYHAAIFNVDSIGVEVSCRGDATKYPDAYARHKEYGANPAGPRKRETGKVRINGHTILGFKFDDRQIESLRMLANALRKHLPNLPLEFPRDPVAPSQPYWGTLGPTNAKGDSYPARDFAGYIAHYHLTTQKWDPGTFNFKDFVEGLRGERVFPVWAGDNKPADDGPPKVPSDKDPTVAATKLEAEVQTYFDLNEKSADGGFFPVGPWGVTRLWHGGIHLPAPEGAPVFAPFPGRVVAARLNRSTDIGSANFVLLRHDLNIASQPMRFWSLYMHVQDEPGSHGPLPWLEEAGKKTPKGAAGSAPSWRDDKVGVIGYDEPVKAGEVIAHVGVVGPDELSKPQLHFEIFSRKPLFLETDPDWTLVDGSAGGRFCDSPEIKALIDTDKDGRMSRAELTAFYQGGVVNDDLRKLVTYHLTEWTDSPPWRDDLQASYADFKKKTGKKGSPKDADDEDLDIDRLVATQLEPFTWWTDDVAAALGLPPDGVVYHYHPMRLLERLNRKLLDTGKAVDLGAVVSTATLNVTEDSEGKDMFHEEVQKELDDQHLGLEDLVKGWDGDRPAPGKGTP